jgi:hypothetical protein
MVTAFVLVSPLLLGACSTIVPARTAARPAPVVVPDTGSQSAISVAGAAAADAPKQTETPTVAAETATVVIVANPGPRWDTAARTVDFSSDGYTRITSHITRTLAAFGRSVRQLVSDIR